MVPCAVAVALLTTAALNAPQPSRRKVVAGAMAGLSAEAMWKQAVSAAEIALEAAPSTAASILPPGTAEQLDAGRAVVLNDWLSPAETAALCADQISCLDAGHFKDFTSNIHRGDIKSMPSFLGNGKNGPWFDASVGDFAVRQNFMNRMAEVKAALSSQLTDRPTLATTKINGLTFDIQYLHYRPGALVSRHVDDRHVELKRPGGARLQKKPDATRRSITWLAYLNDDWDPKRDGGQLRLHERAQPSSHVGALDTHLQVGWLRATATEGEQPVFLDPFRGDAESENCMLITRDANGKTRDLSRAPFANTALREFGGDAAASRLMVDSAADQSRFHLIDGPRRVVSQWLPPGEDGLGRGAAGEDGGERVRDIVPRGGTLVLFDSVSLPHEVLATNRLRYGLQGWFHEKLYY